MVAELATLQNADGGFHGMEADFSSAASSALSTIRALEILDEIDAERRSRMVARALASLRAAYVPAWRAWPLIARHDNRAPHAPWWQWSDDFEESWGFFVDNPRPTMAALLWRFPGHTAAAFRDAITEAVVERATELEPAAVQKDALGCYVHFATSDAVPRAAHEPVLARLPDLVEATLVTDPAQWGGYGLQPLDVAPTPESPLAAAFASTSTATSTTSSRRRGRMAPGARTGAGWAPSPKRGNRRRSPGRVCSPSPACASWPPSGGSVERKPGPSGGGTQGGWRFLCKWYLSKEPPRRTYASMLGYRPP